MWAPVFAANGREYSPIALYTSGRIVVLFRMQGRPPFNDDQIRLELLSRVNEIPGVSLGPEVITQRESIQLTLLSGIPGALEQLKRVLEWIEAEVGKNA
jgi:hypothetical protein